MPLPESVRRLLQPAGLIVGLVGVFVALWAFTGERALEFRYFYTALLGVVLVVAGVVLAAYGRATAPRGRAAKRRKRTKDVAKAQPAKKKAPAEKPPEKETVAKPSPPAKSAPTPEEAPAEGAAESGDTPVTLRCPECATEFTTSPKAEVVCPSCGAVGDVPHRSA